MRKFGVVIFSLILFVSLLALAFSTSTNSALTNPRKIETWLGQSGFYDSFVDTAINQANKTAGNDQDGGVSLSDAAVKQAAESTFSSQLIQKNTRVFLDSNYAWLRGKTDKPAFTIDLTSAKASFAQKVGKYVTTYLSTLPACTPSQTAQINLSSIDPLTLQCRPTGLDPKTEGALVTEQIESNGNFLSNPVITAKTFNTQGETDATPYYQKLASAPKMYQTAVKVPWIAGILTILSSIGVLFLAVRKRKGFKVIGVLLAISGLTLVLTRLVSDQIFKAVEGNIFNQASVGSLQKSLTGFLHHVESQIVKVDFWFGIAYLLLALVILALLIGTRQRGLRMPKPLQNLTPSDTGPLPAASAQPSNDKPSTRPKPRPSKPRRLVQ